MACHHGLLFAHNGNVENFEECRSDFLNEIDQELRFFILGHTDSEVLFYFLLTLMKKCNSEVYFQSYYQECELYIYMHV